MDGRGSTRSSVCILDDKSEDQSEVEVQVSSGKSKRPNGLHISLNQIIKRVSSSDEPSSPTQVSYEGPGSPTSPSPDEPKTPTTPSPLMNNDESSMSTQNNGSMCNTRFHHVSGGNDSNIDSRSTDMLTQGKNKIRCRWVITGIVAAVVVAFLGGWFVPNPFIHNKSQSSHVSECLPTPNLPNKSQNSHVSECHPQLSALTQLPPKDRAAGIRQKGGMCDTTNCETCALGMRERDNCPEEENPKWKNYIIKCGTGHMSYCLQCGGRNYSFEELQSDDNWNDGQLGCSIAESTSIPVNDKCCLLRDLGNRNGYCKNGGELICYTKEKFKCTPSNTSQIKCNCHKNIPLVEEDPKFDLALCNKTTFNHSRDPLCLQRIDLPGDDNYKSCYCYNNETVSDQNLQSCK